MALYTKHEIRTIVRNSKSLEEFFNIQSYLLENAKDYLEQKICTPLFFESVNNWIEKRIVNLIKQS